HATRIAAARGVECRGDLVFLACVMHDIGTADAFDGPQRFEVHGADAAAEFLRGNGFGAADVDQVWEAIALHTSPHIAERRGPVPMLTRLGVLEDFSGNPHPDVEQRYPRLDVERVLADAVVAQALRNPAKAPASSWPGGLLRAHLAADNEE